MFTTNAKLTIQVESGDPTSFDSVTGAPIFTMNPISVYCSLEETNNPDPIEIPGVDKSSLFLTGRAVSPKLLPKSFRHSTFMNITYDSPQGKQAGKFYLLPGLKGRLGLEGVFGDFIAGYAVLN